MLTATRDELVMPLDLAALLRRTLLSFLLPAAVKRGVRECLAGGMSHAEILILVNRRGAATMTECVSAYIEQLKGA